MKFARDIKAMYLKSTKMSQETAIWNKLNSAIPSELKSVLQASSLRRIKASSSKRPQKDK